LSTLIFNKTLEKFSSFVFSVWLCVGKEHISIKTFTSSILLACLYHYSFHEKSSIIKNKQFFCHIFNLFFLVFLIFIYFCKRIQTIDSIYCLDDFYQTKQFIYL